MVSEADETRIIQEKIVQSLYNDPIVVCDVSGKNPNVMFELGMRLAFDRPTVIVKDDATDFSFDTGPIEHLPYRRDLRYHEIVNFGEKLEDKIKATHDAPDKSDYQSFLQTFGRFKVPKIEPEEVPKYEYIADRLDSMNTQMARLARLVSAREAETESYPRQTGLFAHPEASEIVREVVEELKADPLANEASREDLVRTAARRINRKLSKRALRLPMGVVHSLVKKALGDFSG